MTPFELDLSGYDIEVKVPDVHVSTREAYAGVTPGLPAKPLETLLALPAGQWRGAVVNDFEPGIFAAHPQLAAIKEDMYRRGAVYASMSGSGSSIFGIFRK